jgi:hypothetical protein
MVIKPVITPRKRILYNGKLADGSKILVCTPQSKLQTNGCEWINITIIQVSMPGEADYSTLAFHLEGDKVYYLDLCDLKPYLTEEARLNNYVKKEIDPDVKKYKIGILLTVCLPFSSGIVLANADRPAFHLKISPSLQFPS